MDNLIKDIRFGIRMLLAKPGFTVAAILTLALGIGANTAIFSIVEAVLLRPLPYKEPDRIVAVWETDLGKGGERWRVAPANYFDWREQSAAFEEMALLGASSLNLTGAGEPEQLLGVRVSAGYFAVLGVEPVIGRSFLPEEDAPGKGQVVILSHGLWQRRFGSDPDIAGKTVTMDGNIYTIVGVMPPDIYPSWPTTSAKIMFQHSHQQFWIPAAFSDRWRASRRSHILGVIGRLKPGVTLDQAQAEMNTVAARLEQSFPENEDEGILVSPLMYEMVGNVRPALLVLLGTVGFVLLIACANIASLLLARFAARNKEIAIRAALGGTRLRLVRQFMVEGFLLSLLGGLTGVWLAVFGVDLIMKIIPEEIPRLDQVGLDAGVLLFTLLLAFVASLVFGLVPAIQSSKPNLLETLKEGGRTSSVAGRQRLRRMLVVFQVGMAVVLVVGAGLLIKSFRELQRVDPGFNPDGVLVMDMTLPQSKYSEWHEVSGFYTQLLERINNLPGVKSAVLAYNHPLEATWINSFSIEDRPQPEEQPVGKFRPVSAGYFRAMGIGLLRGREFTAQDDPDHPGVVIVNETLARRYFSGEEALGKRLGIGPPTAIWGDATPASFEIVGVVRDVKFLGLEAEVDPAFYVPTRQSPLSDMNVLVRTEGDPAALVASMRKEVWSLDSDQPISQVRTMEEIVAINMAQRRFNMLLMGLFGAVALILASVGIYGLLSYTVAQRTHEIGVRMALGASRSDVLKMVVGQGMALAVTGVMMGLIASFALTRLMESLLFGVSATDPLTFAAVSLLLITVALLACYLPARRATKVDPMVALRYE